MLWLILSVLTALSVASQEAWTKKFFGHLSAFEMSGYLMAYSLPLFTAALFFVAIPPLDPSFFSAFALCLPVNALAFIIYMTAIRISPLSLTLPYLAFTPVFIILTGNLLLGETIGTWGELGILGICLGSYVLNINPAHPGFTAPLKAIFREKGSWLMLIAASLFSLTAVLGKVGILHSSVMFFSMSFFAINNIALLLLLMLIGKIRPRILVGSPIKGLIVGVLLFLHVTFHGWAMLLSKAAYMMAIKRTSVLFGMLYGWLLFQEENLFFRFGGALLMLAGAVIIGIAGT